MRLPIRDDQTPPGASPARSNPLIPTVFHNPWWLEAASGGRYEEVEVRASGRQVARLPYVVHRKPGGFKLCTMPEMTHFLGPAVDPGQGSEPTRLLRQFDLTRELLDKLGPFASVSQQMHRGVTDTLAFADAGYETSVEFTMEIAPRPESEIWTRMRDKTRNVIRRAEERWPVVTLDDPERFAAFYDANLRARGLVSRYPQNAALCAAAIAHGQGRLLGATSEAGVLLGAVFIIWDQDAAYYRLSTRSSEADNGVISLLLWHAIRDAAGRGIVFDFDGIGTSGSRLFFTGFGGRVAPRFKTTKHSTAYRAARTLRRFVGSVGAD